VSKKEKTEKDLLLEISLKLDKILGVLAIQNKKEDIQIRILKNLGFSSSQAGAILGINPSSLRDKKGWKGA